jgi:von Willebrand factor type A domain
MDSSKQKKLTFLSLAVMMAVTFHLLAGYGLYEMKITNESDDLALIENHLQYEQNEHHSLLSAENDEKNAILVEAFQQLYTDNYNEMTTADETNEFLTDFDTQSNESSLYEATSSTLEEALWSIPIDQELTSIDEHDLLESLSENTPEIFLPEGLTQLLHPDENRLAKDIIQATESLHGMVIDDTITYYTELPAVQFGNEDSAFDDGNSLQDCSGVIERGRTDAEATNEAGALASYLGKHDHDEDLIAYATQEEMRPSLSSIQKQQPSYYDNYPKNYSDKQKSTIGHIASSEDFTVNVEYAPMNQGKGYLFKIELEPKNDIQFRRIKQNVTFLIDRSYSIDKNRFQMTKVAVADSIRSLSPDDSFNIIVFDQHTTKLANQPIPKNTANITRADRFLREQQHGSMFTATDVTSPLNGIIPRIVADNEINTAILLSDGDTTLNPAGQWETIREWTKENNGKVSLYTMASGQKNNFPMLDMISVFNKGSLYVAINHQQIRPILKELMKDIQTPIGKNIVATIVPKNETTTVRFFPTQHHMPNLYDNQPFTLYGYTNSLDNFYLFFQGKYYNKRINIKQQITLRNGKKVPSYELEKAWALQNAYELYNKYLVDFDEEHLQQAKQILSPYNLSIAIGF